MRGELENIPVRGHEEVVVCQDATRGYLAIIAVHDTTLGPALGGCRIRPYDSLEVAMRDALRLSEAMTYKSALCGNDLGGGKSVIISGPIAGEERVKLFTWFGKCVERLGGRYVTAEDMNTSVADMSIVQSVTQYVSGSDPSKGGGGDPSPYTARGVFAGMRACLEHVFGSGDFTGRHVALQGVGAVGTHLLLHLKKAGAKLTITDTNEAKLRELSAEYGATIVEPSQIYDVECDIFSPCAIGSTVSAETVARLKCPIIAGAANNQLSDDSVENDLAKKEILYAPDFAINSGGVILCAEEYSKGPFSADRTAKRSDNVYNTIKKILDENKNSGMPTGQIAVKLAKERIAAKKL